MKREDPIHTLKGVGPKTEQKFHKAGIDTVDDLLRYYPVHYERYERTTS